MQVEAKILSSIRDQTAKKQRNKGTAKNYGTREVAYTCRSVDTLVDI